MITPNITRALGRLETMVADTDVRWRACVSEAAAKANLAKAKAAVAAVESARLAYQKAQEALAKARVAFVHSVPAELLAIGLAAGATGAKAVDEARRVGLDGMRECRPNQIGWDADGFGPRFAEARKSLLALERGADDAARDAVAADRVVSRIACEYDPVFRAEQDAAHMAAMAAKRAEGSDVDQYGRTVLDESRQRGYWKD